MGWEEWSMHLLHDKAITGAKMHIKSVSLFFILIYLFFFSSICIAQKASGAASPDDPQFLYMRTVQDHVNKNWSYKKTLDNQFYSVQLDLVLNREGYVLEQKILKLSSDDEYNKYALKALVEMEPYPPIPDELEGDKMSVRFHLMPNK
jgi:hypothetical protein